MKPNVTKRNAILVVDSKTRINWLGVDTGTLVRTGHDNWWTGAAWKPKVIGPNFYGNIPPLTPNPPRVCIHQS